MTDDNNITVTSTERFTMVNEDEELIASLGALSATYPVLRYFTWAHLPQHLRPTSRTFAALALRVGRARPTGHPETATALRKLLEAKDAAVRADLPDPQEGDRE